ncbi:MAG: hypothetical protein KF914_21845, partial [Rhizobiaceae bacterium]|nr:hypothetical protein [Rhizobiaceae bacterium]
MVTVAANPSPLANVSRASSGSASSTANSVALRLLGGDVRSNLVSPFATGTPEHDELLEGLEAVGAEWAFANTHSRWTNADGGTVIDGYAFAKLTDAILANREKFPSGEFTVKIAWSDGASIETTIPAIERPRVSSFSMGPVLALASEASPPHLAASAQALYQEWR